MKLVRNLGAGLVSSVWTAVLAIAVVPFYLRYMGIESYGLIGFFATTQALFQILDMGIVPTVNREIARGTAAGRWEDVRSLLHTLAAVYWCVAALICALMLVCAPAISGHWLKSNSLSQETIKHATMLMGLVIACRWPIGLYQAALNGLQRIEVSSGINILMTSLGSVGAVCILGLISPTVEAFFLWQAGVGLAHAITMKGAAWRAIGRATGARLDWRALKAIWRFSASMMALAFSGLVFAQLDKVLLSRLLSLDVFGKYMLAGTVAHSLGILFTPFYNAVYPRFSAYIARDQLVRSIDLYNLSSRLLAIGLFSIAIIIAVGGEDVIRFWTGNPLLAADVAPLATVLVIGTALHGTTYIPYAFCLAQGKTFIPLSINLVLLIVMIPTTICLAISYGAMGGAVAWLILHALYVLLNTGLMQRYVGFGTGVPWLLNDVGIPLLICAAMGFIAKFAVRSVDAGTPLRLTFVCLIAFGSVALNFAVSARLRHSIIGAFRVERAK